MPGHRILYAHACEIPLLFRFGVAPLMSAPNGLTHVRLAGFLRMTERGPILECRDDSLWRVRSDDDLTSFTGSDVIVEGTPHGQELTLLWIGFEPDGKPSAV